MNTKSSKYLQVIHAMPSYKMYFSYNNKDIAIIEYYDTEEEALEAGRKYLKEHYNAFRVEWYVKKMEE